ncbi:MAG TPA: hypothetical protein VKM55_10755 [Candidatus Lokiarchaeia archaeon]|nr:hypothetical protein [Candidatus Lokiarchaeia archaeon]
MDKQGRKDEARAMKREHGDQDRTGKGWMQHSTDREKKERRMLK